MKYYLLLIIISIALPLSAQNSKKVKQMQKEQAALKKQIGEGEKLLRSTKKDVGAQLANLKTVNTQIAAQQNLVNGYRAEAEALGEQIEEQEQTLRALEADLQACKKKYQRAVMYMFRNRAAQNKWLFILSASNFQKMYRRLRYVQEYSKYQRAEAETIRQKELVVQQKRKELLSSKTQKDVALREGEAQQRVLEGQKKERENIVAELNKKQSQLQDQLKKQRQQAAALDRKIDAQIQAEIAAAEKRRKAEEARRKAEEEKRRAAEAKKAAATKTTKNAKNEKNTKAAQPSKPATTTPTYKPASDADRALSGSFEANRGRLPMPITGSYFISTHFGTHGVAGLSGVTLDSKGIDITGRAGAQARAVFDGEVSSVFSYGGLYHIIIRHGAYLSVYCNLSSASVRQGAKVKRGQTLGPVAADASGNPVLQFQLRKETTKLNPEAWLAK